MPEGKDVNDLTLDEFLKVPCKLRDYEQGEKEIKKIMEKTIDFLISISYIYNMDRIRYSDVIVLFQEGW